MRPQLLLLLLGLHQVTAHDYCLPAEQRVSLPLLRRAYNEFRARFRGGTAVRIAKKPWLSAEIIAEITKILAVEALGYHPQDVMFTLDRRATPGSYQDLDLGVADVDMELWRSIAPIEAAKFINSSRNNPLIEGGDVYYARSGIFLRPSPSDAAMILDRGRFYSALNDTIIPLLPTAAELIAGGYCDLGSTDDCLALPNRRCASEPCKALIKSFASYDADTVQEMIINASLPLVIFYSGGSERRIFDELSNRTLLFYHWEPDSLIPPGSSVVRLNFDDPSACRSNLVHADYPSRFSCDFDSGGIHKAMAGRIDRDFDEFAFMIRNFQIESNELLNLLIEGDANTSATAYSLACQWVQTNRATWRGTGPGTGWLVDSYDQHNTYQLWLSGITLGLVIAWLMYPCLQPPPEAGNQWTALVGRSTEGHLGVLAFTIFQLTTFPFYFLRFLFILVTGGSHKLVKSVSKAIDRAKGKFYRIHPEPHGKERSFKIKRSLRKSASTRSMDRQMAMLDAAVKDHTREYEAAASMIQGIYRHKNLEDGFNYRGMAKNRLAEGVQVLPPLRSVCGRRSFCGLGRGCRALHRIRDPVVSGTLFYSSHASHGLSRLALPRTRCTCTLAVRPETHVRSGGHDRFQGGHHSRPLFCRAAASRLRRGV